MNTRPAIDESAGPVSLSVAFNQDSSCFSVGLDSGFCGTYKSFYTVLWSTKAEDLFLQSSILTHVT